MRGIAGGLSRYLGQWSPPHSLVLVALRRLGSLQCTVGAILTVGVVKAVDAFYCIVCKLRICSNARMGQEEESASLSVLFSHFK